MGVTIEDEKKLDKLQVVLIYLRAGITAVISIGSKLRYTAAPTLNNPLDIPTKDYVDNAISAGLTSVTLVFLQSDFSGSGDLTFATTPGLAAYFAGVPTIIIRQLIGAGVYDFLENIRPRYDGSANTLTFNSVPFDGDITFKI